MPRYLKNVKALLLEAWITSIFPMRLSSLSLNAEDHLETVSLNYKALSAV